MTGEECRIQIHTPDPWIRQALREGFRDHARRLDLAWRVDSFGNHDAFLAPAGADLLVAHRASPALETTCLGSGQALLLCVAHGPELRFPCIGFDDRMMGREAARHLTDAGWPRALVLSKAWAPASQTRREQAFIEEFQRLGGQCTPVVQTPELNTQPAVRAWFRGHIEAQERPFAVFAYQDGEAVWLCSALRDLGLRIPQDVGLISCEDSPAAWTAEPPLSSVRASWRVLAHHAAMAAQRFLAGGAWEPLPLVAPLGVAVRESTLPPDPGDGVVTRALRLMRRALPHGLTNDQVAHRLGVSRDTVERHFRRALRQSPHQAMVRLRMTEAERLLAEEPALTVEAIARRCGWSDSSHLALDFRRLRGTTPARFRIGHP